MKESELTRPWWVIPSGYIRPIWFLATIPLLVAGEYAAGPNNAYPLLYSVPVFLAAWCSGRRAALALAVAVPLSQLIFLFSVWRSPPDLTGLSILIFRATAILVIAIVFARQAEYERELRHDMQRRHALELRAEQLRVVQVTMRSVEDIVNNTLNQLQLLRLEADGLVSEETVASFDGAIREASAKLKRLSELQEFAEKQMAIGMGLDVGEHPPSAT
jgi:hypothetical protein